MKWIVLLGLAWLVSACGEREDAATRIERRMLAPCCFRQSIEDHESPIAHALRAEIEARVARGEPAAQIEGSLVARYGEGIRAAPPTRWAVVLFVGLAAAVGLIVVLRLASRRAPAVTAASTDGERAYGERFERELAEID